MTYRRERKGIEFAVWLAVILIAAMLLMWILRVALYLVSLVFAFASACIAGWIGRNRRIGFPTAFLIGLVLPGLGIVVALLSRRVEED